MVPPPPPRELVSDAICEILLRLPPDEPQWLFRAALVCKPWLRTLTDPTFLRRYRDFHGTPPLLGLIDADKKNNGESSSRLIPTTAIPAFPLPWLDSCCGRPLDCRHGRILVGNEDDEDARVSYLVCDPLTGGSYRLPQPEIKIAGMPRCAAVFCAASGCQHLDCRGGPFCVVLLGKDYSSIGKVTATIYSSEIGAWNAPSTLEGVKHQVYGCGALIRGEIYFMLVGDTGIIKYEWQKNCLSLVNPPPSAVDYNWVTLTVTEDSSLGLAGTEDTTLYQWSRRVISEGTTEWVQYRVIDLDAIIPRGSLSEEKALVVGFAEGVGVIFVSTSFALFMIELKSKRVRKVHNSCILRVLPYMDFYTPDLSRLSHLGGPAIL